MNEEFCLMSETERKNFILSCVKRKPIQRKTTDGNSKRKKSLFYYFKDKNGSPKQVCKTFFLSTLGFKATNDRIIRSSLLNMSDNERIKAKTDGRKQNKRSIVVDRTLIRQHIQSFSPQKSHYRREHAPDRFYLPDDISITLMYKHFMENNPDMKFSYYLYRDEVAKMNISFTKLGHEECFACEQFNLHGKETGHKKDAPLNDCEPCNAWKVHHSKYVTARRNYQEDAEDQHSEKLTLTADLQKVITDLIFYVLYVLILFLFTDYYAPKMRYIQRNHIYSSIGGL